MPSDLEVMLDQAVRAGDAADDALLGGRADGPEGWYYVSVAGGEFVGGYVLPARGETDAWCRAHSLNWVSPDCSTRTYGPIPADVLAHIPESQRLRKLTADECKNLGKPS